MKPPVDFTRRGPKERQWIFLPECAECGRYDPDQPVTLYQGHWLCVDCITPRILPRLGEKENDSR